MITPQSVPQWKSMSKNTQTNRWQNLNGKNQRSILNICLVSLCHWKFLFWKNGMGINDIDGWLGTLNSVRLRSTGTKMLKIGSRTRYEKEERWLECSHFTFWCDVRMLFLCSQICIQRLGYFNDCNINSKHFKSKNLKLYILERDHRLFHLLPLAFYVSMDTLSLYS